MHTRAAIVTGGGRGIGRAIALALARDGRSVAVADLLGDQARAVAAEIVEDGGSAIAVELDVTEPASVQSGIDMAEGALGPLEILVNNAGWDELRPFLDTDEQFWERVLDVNFKGALRMTHALLPGMLERRFGRIVSIGSDAGRVGSSLESVYSGAKGGVIAFTKTIAREAARAGVTANTVCPGPTDTPMLAAILAAHEDAERVIGAMTRAVPMRRLAQPQEIAAAVAFFASEQAAYITGQTLSVSGGLTMA
ncbi:MAG: SDR family oxidoreductase [Solirubrobacteraceae bacterium]|jgi:2-hydroxycyclohexanecarboxyl-CoA dehydrogenase